MSKSYLSTNIVSLPDLDTYLDILLRKWNKVKKKVSSWAKSLNTYGKPLSWKQYNTFCFMNEDKSRVKRIFETVHWPFKLPPN